MSNKLAIYYVREWRRDGSTDIYGSPTSLVSMLFGTTNVFVVYTVYNSVIIIHVHAHTVHNYICSLRYLLNKLSQQLQQERGIVPTGHMEG